jgi:hypothetical protein
LDLAVVVSFALLQELLGRALIMFQALHLADKPDFLPLWVKQRPLIFDFLFGYYRWKLSSNFRYEKE